MLLGQNGPMLSGTDVGVDLDFNCRLLTLVISINKFDGAEAAIFLF